jgi:hypothetical protein
MRVSIAREATQATLSLSAKNLWQLTVRGGKLSETADPQILRIDVSGQRLNWALKSIARAPVRAAKAETAELPF